MERTGIRAYTHHKLLRETPYPGITGGKTGYIEEAGFTLATTAEQEGLSLIAIILNSPNQSGSYEDTVTLLDYGFEHFKFENNQLVDTHGNPAVELRKLENRAVLTAQMSLESPTKTTNGLAVARAQTHTASSLTKATTRNDISVDLNIIGIVLIFAWIQIRIRVFQKR
ncbi:D-alanyl-D-alanine carboxypeptidase family protein [Ornithinibacillus contaminans]|uniref:hypothetical protein n=1 Tax=Ornithinibacillus contaminans TaxID=694055 RepID=UPI00064DB8D0|nr:hypothetical protein [Ornithinibacillus contaminans]